MMEFQNPAVMVPLGAFAVAIAAIVGGIWSDAHNKRLKADQRMAMIARGMSVAEMERVLGKPGENLDERRPKDPLRSLGNARRAAIVLISVGVGVMLFFALLEVVIGVREIFSGVACGLIPFAIGVGFLIDYQLQKRELSRFGLELGTDLPADQR
jgi:hypothetical protein